MDINHQVNYQSTNNVFQASLWLRKLPATVALDFETASNWSDEEKQIYRDQLTNDDSLSFRERRLLQQRIDSDGLSHPSLSRITHMSLAISDSTAYVFVIDNRLIERMLMNWLITTTIKQIWHNAGFDFKLIMYRTGKCPLNYEDTQIQTKCLINHCENQKSKTGLKELMGHRYGSWGISEDNFNISQMYEPRVLQYAATDACATYSIYEQLLITRIEGLLTTITDEDIKANIALLATNLILTKGYSTDDAIYEASFADAYLRSN